MFSVLKRTTFTSTKLSEPLNIHLIAKRSIKTTTKMNNSIREKVFVDPKWLNSQLSNPNVRVFDCSWELKKSKWEEYLEKHIPKAVWFSVSQNIKILLFMLKRI